MSVEFRGLLGRCQQINRRFACARLDHGQLVDLLAPGFDVEIAELAARHHLPAMYEVPAYVDAGGLIAYGPDGPELTRRSALFVDKILKGAKAGDLPIEQPTKYQLAINLKAAQALGLAIPQSLMLRANQRFSVSTA